MFVDGTTPMYSAETLDNKLIGSGIVCLLKWITCNRLYLNVDKSESHWQISGFRKSLKNSDSEVPGRSFRQKHLFLRYCWYDCKTLVKAHACCRKSQEVCEYTCSCFVLTFTYRTNNSIWSFNLWMYNIYRITSYTYGAGKLSCFFFQKEKCILLLKIFCPKFIIFLHSAIIEICFEISQC